MIPPKPANPRANCDQSNSERLMQTFANFLITSANANKSKAPFMPDCCRLIRAVVAVISIIKAPMAATDDATRSGSIDAIALTANANINIAADILIIADAWRFILSLPKAPNNLSNQLPSTVPVGILFMRARVAMSSLIIPAIPPKPIATFSAGIVERSRREAAKIAIAIPILINASALTFIAKAFKHLETLPRILDILLEKSFKPKASSIFLKKLRFSLSAPFKLVMNLLTDAIKPAKAPC